MKKTNRHIKSYDNFNLKFFSFLVIAGGIFSGLIALLINRFDLFGISLIFVIIGVIIMIYIKIHNKKRDKIRK